MIIPVILAPKDSNPKLPSGLVKISHDEIVLIELQGVLEVELNNPTERNGGLVGKLSIDDATNKPSLLIGHHLLEGKIAPLPKPCAIFMRTAGHNKSTNNELKNHAGDEDVDDHHEEGGKEDEDDLDAMQVDGDGEAHESEGGSSSSGPELPRGGWAIAGIVKKKIIFSKRPMPVIGKKS